MPGTWVPGGLVGGGARGRKALGFSVTVGGWRRVRGAVGGAGSILPAEPGQGALPPIDPPPGTVPDTCVPGGSPGGGNDRRFVSPAPPFTRFWRCCRWLGVSASGGGWHPPLCRTFLSSAKDALSPPPKRAVGKEAGGAVLAGAFHPDIRRATTQG